MNEPLSKAMPQELLEIELNAIESQELSYRMPTGLERMQLSFRFAFDEPENQIPFAVLSRSVFPKIWCPLPESRMPVF